jgi:CelD/BcsL family acetyltransferase involved in cellulose biosynthesis
MHRIEVIPAAALPAGLVQRWLQIQQSSTELRHPMLSAAFIQCVAQHRADVQVAVIESAEQVIGLFPFQQDRGTVGYPAAYRLNDYQGGVFVPDADINAVELLRGCGLSMWHFDHLVISQPCFAAGHFLYENSPYIDLSQGFEAYRSTMSRSSRWQSTLRKGRNLEREIGPVRFEFHTVESEPYRALIDWKSSQVRRNRKRCVFDWPWVLQSLEELRVTENEACAGTLSALYAGKHLVAAHLGLRSREVLHWWITAYNPEFSRYSPGSVLLVRLIEEAARRGLQRIDLGKGDEPYKATFQSGARPLASGAICTSGWNGLYQRTSCLLKERIRTSPVAAPAKAMAYWLEARVNRTRK